MKVRRQPRHVCAIALLLLLPTVLAIAGPADAAGPRVVEIDAQTLHGGDQFVVTGTVTQDGAPVPGASVHLQRAASYSFSGASPEDLGTLTTDADGRFSSTAPGIASDVVTYRAELPSGSGSIDDSTDRLLWIERLPVTISIESAPERIVAGVPFTATVHVTDSNGPLSGMPVSMTVPQVEGGYELIPGPPTGVTDEQGDAVVTGLAAKGGAEGVNDAIWAFANGTLTHDNAVSGTSRHVEFYPTQITLDAPSSLAIDETARVTGHVACPSAAGTTVGIALGVAGGGSARVADDGTFSATITATTYGTQLVTRLVNSKACSPGTRYDPIEVRRLSTQLEVPDLPAEVPLWTRVPITGEVRADRYDYAWSSESVQLFIDDVLVDYQDRPGLFYFSYQPTGEVGSSHKVELRYSGNPRWAPASKSWTVATGEAAPTVVLSAPPTAYAPGDALILGRVTGAPPGTTMTLTSPSGSTVPVTLVDLGGGDARFSAWSTLPIGLVGATATWTARVAPEAGRISATQGSVDVPVEEPPVTTVLDRASYVPGQTIHLKVIPHQPLDGNPLLRLVVRGRATPVTTTWSSKDEAFVADLHTGENTELVVGVSQRVPYDSPAVRVRPSSLIRVVLPLRTSALSPITRIGSYAVYNQEQDPLLRTIDRITLWGPQAKCLHSQVQRLGRDRRWHTVVDRVCDREDLQQRVSFRYTGARTAGSRFRVRSLYTADHRWERSPSRWAYFRFR